MTESRDTDLLYLTHICECLTRITKYTLDGQANFLEDHKTQDAVLRNLQTMAESTQRLSSELKATAPEVPWRKIAGFRNVLAHDYLGVKLERIWQTIQVDLPPFAEQIGVMREDLEATHDEGTQT